MEISHKNQVSLRGASAKEISREALLEKLSHERELRNYARRATASAILFRVCGGTMLQEMWPFSFRKNGKPC